MNNKKKAFNRLLVALLVFLPPFFVYAEPVDIEASCNGIFTPEAMELIREILGYFAILGPTVLIIMLAVDFLRSIGSSNPDEFKKANGRAVKRIIATLCLFLVPTIVSILLNLPGVNDYLRSTGILNDPLCGGGTGNVGYRITYSQSTTKYTKSPVKITVTIEKGEAKYAIDSNGKRYDITNNSFTFTADKSGNYEFKIYNAEGKLVMTKTISIQNIVTEGPKGNCTINNGVIYVSATSRAGVYAYSYEINGKYTSYIKESSYKTELSTTKATVNVQDNAGNITNIECKNTGIKPQIPATGNVVWSADSESLKVNIEESSKYLATRVWAANPYEQLKIYTASDFHKTSSSISTIMNNTINNLNLQNKIVIATNNLVSNTYGSFLCTSKNYPKYTCMNLVMKNGQVMYEDAGNGNPSSIAFGLTMDGKLKPYPFRKGTTAAQKTARQKLIDEAKNDGIKNTHMSINVLLLDSQVKEKEYAPIFKTHWEDGDTAKRTGMCQVDTNNFVMFTTKSSITIRELTKIMQSYNCKYGYNLDGGNSTTLKVKNGSEASLHRVNKVGTEGERGGMWGILYFTEL